MSEQLESLRSDVFSAFHQLGRNHPRLEDAIMLVGSSDAAASLRRRVVRRAIEEEWVSRVEAALPCLDAVIRQPFRAIEDVEDVVPVELSRRVSEKSIRHLSQHTNLIRKVEGDEITPSKILNVYHEETLVTYENRFTNTLIRRLFTFVDRRYQLLGSHFATEQDYDLTYTTKFQHQETEFGETRVDFQLKMNLETPLLQGLSEEEEARNREYREQLQRVERIYHTVLAYMNSDFCRKLGKNLIRPPVIRTNAILKNKNLRVCLDLWEFIQGYEKVGCTIAEEQYQEVPSEAYVRDFYHSAALQYVQFYSGVLEDSASNRLLTAKSLSEVAPNFDSGALEQEETDYTVYDSEYRKTVPVSRLMSSRKKLSEDEQRIRRAIEVALDADAALEEERRRQAEEARRKAEEEKRRREAEEAERRRLAREEEQRRLAAEMEKARLQKEEEERQRAEQARLQKLREEEEARRKEEEARRLREEEELRQMAEEIEALRLAEEQRRREEAEALERRRLQEEEDRRHYEECLLVAEAERLFYHSREEYLSLPRKKKKRILTDLRAMQEYEQLLQQEKAHPTGRTIVKPKIQNWEELRRWERSVLPKKK